MVGGEHGMLGIIVGGGTSALGALGAPSDASLTPFAGRYRLLDFAVASLVNSGAAPIYVVTTTPSSALRDHLASCDQLTPDARDPLSLTLPGGVQGHGARLLAALRRTAPILRSHRPEAVVLVFSDHILHLDVRPIVTAHRHRGADVTLGAVLLPTMDAPPSTMLAVDAEWRVRDAMRAPRHPPPLPGFQALALAWAGVLVVTPRRLPGVIASLSAADATSDDRSLARLASGSHVAAYDIHATGSSLRTYWQEPASVETYYEAQMSLCTPQPVLDLNDRSWPVLASPSRLGPARIVADSTGRMGQALNTLVSDGNVIQGGVAVNSVLGAGVVIESGAEVEHAVLLEGARVGRGAQVRRALIGAGAVLSAGESIGYGTPPPPAASRCASGLTLIPPGPPAIAAAAR